MNEGNEAGYFEPLEDHGAVRKSPAKLLDAGDEEEPGGMTRSSSTQGHRNRQSLSLIIVVSMPSERSRRRDPHREFPVVPTTGEMPLDFLPLVMRSAVVITPRQPYWDWAATCPSRHQTAVPGSWTGSVFLIPAFSDMNRLDAYLEAHHPYAFAEVLSQVTQAVDDWPQNRTSTMFRAWFEVKFVLGVHDLAGEPLQVMSTD
jgi:hypothetical protein